MAEYIYYFWQLILVKGYGHYHLILFTDDYNNMG